jgi:hypothetical protein
MNDLLLAIAILALAVLAVLAVVQVVINRQHRKALIIVSELTVKHTELLLTRSRCLAIVPTASGPMTCGNYLRDGQCLIHGAGT